MFFGYANSAPQRAEKRETQEGEGTGSGDREILVYRKGGGQGGARRESQSNRIMHLRKETLAGTQLTTYSGGFVLILLSNSL